MFKEQAVFNANIDKGKLKDSIDNKNEALDTDSQRDVHIAPNSINEDRLESQKIANLTDNEKALLFFKKYEGDPSKFFEKENFVFLKSLNYHDRNLAWGAISTNKLSEGQPAKYRKEFPEDKAIADIGLKLFIDLEHYTYEDDARINNEEYERVLAKLSEMRLFLDRDLGLIKGNSEDFDYFTESYKLFVSGIKEDAKELNKVINTSFHENVGNFSEIFSAIISRAESKLLELEQALKTKGNFSEIIANFVQELNSASKNRTENIQELGKVSAQLNKQYYQLGENVLEGIASIYNIEDQIMTDEQLVKSISNPEDSKLVSDDFQRRKKFSAERLKKLIAYYKDMVEIESYHPAALSMVRVDFEKYKSKNGEKMAENFDWDKKIKEYNGKFPPRETDEQNLYKKTIKKLQQALPLQIALEKKMDQLVYGQEDSRLPKGFTDFEGSKVSPENIPSQIPLYFPVGISKDLISWEQVLAGEKKFLKPIDIYGYLFWLNNQDRKVNLVICDEIQVNNYQARYGRSKNEARQEAREIGNREAKGYEKIISTFGLDNIKIQRYPEFINENKADYKYYNGLIKKLALKPEFKEAFLAMVQESVSGAEEEKYIAYAFEELTWILSTNGTKIGHLNEARYDILALVIRSFKQASEAQGLDFINDFESPAVKAVLNTVIHIIRDIINEKKSKLARGSSSFAYFKRLQDHLDKIKIDPKVAYDKSIRKSSLAVNFVCPEVGSASFGFRGNFEGKESVIKFKEPYSTYFYHNISDLLINSDQVVAAGEGLIGGKILTFNNKKQLKYAEQVVRPILKYYFASLEKAPKEYFQKLNKNREELLTEVGKAESLLDVLHFIQKYIVKPTELI